MAKYFSANSLPSTTPLRSPLGANSVPTPGMTTPLVDPLGPDQGQAYVIRGSSWRHAGETELRLSFRDYGNSARSDLGFRIARSLD